MLEDPTFDERLKAALKAPKSPDAKKFMDTILPLLRQVGKHLRWSALERAAELAKLRAELAAERKKQESGSGGPGARRSGGGAAGTISAP